MQVSEVMTTDAKLIGPDDTLQQAAQLMRENDCGVLPVQEGDKLVGMITDRDITVRCVATGKGPDTKVREAMSEDVKYCYVDEELEEVSENMANIQVRRLPVLNREKRLVGIISLGDLAREESETAQVLQDIVKKGGQHNQT